MKKILLFLVIISLFLVACQQQADVVVTADAQTAESEPEPTVKVTPPAEVEEPAVEEEPEPVVEVVEPEPQAEPASTLTIEMTNSGWEPATLTIDQGDTVTFLNMVSRKVWPASVIHPTHTVYPGSSIQKCSSEPDVIFDACSALKEGESYSFTFNEEGTWGYHDHRSAGFTGTITVE